MDDFYIYLYSGASTDYYPDNTITNFKNQYVPPIELEGDYEVALTQLTLVPDHFIVRKGEILGTIWYPGGPYPKDTPTVVHARGQKPYIDEEGYLVSSIIADRNYDNAKDLVEYIAKVSGEDFSVDDEGKLRKKYVKLNNRTTRMYGTDLTPKIMGIIGTGHQDEVKYYDECTVKEFKIPDGRVLKQSKTQCSFMPDKFELENGQLIFCKKGQLIGTYIINQNDKPVELRCTKTSYSWGDAMNDFAKVTGIMTQIYRRDLLFFVPKDDKKIYSWDATFAKFIGNGIVESKIKKLNENTDYYGSKYALLPQAGNSRIYVYSNVGKYQYVGDVVAPILRVIPNKNELNQRLETHFDHLYYVDVASDRFEYIQMYLRNESGNPPPLLHEPCSATLHFRRKR